MAMYSPRVARFIIASLFCGLLSLRVYPQDVKVDPLRVYPESTEGLRSLLEDFFRVIRANDTPKHSQLLSVLSLPNHTEWFLKTFNSTEGPRLDAKYVEIQSEASAAFQKRIETAIKDAKDRIIIREFKKPVKTIRLFSAATEAMVKPIAIYEAEANTGPGDVMPDFVGDFVFVEGRFRALDQQVFQALSSAPPLRIRLAENEVRKGLIQRVEPQYSPLVRGSGLSSGSVVLRVTLRTDGSVQQVQVVSGHPLLVQSVLNAVRKWRYQPVLLNGVPVEVDTIVTVEYHN